MEIPTWGALLALVLSIFLILKNISPAYALITGAIVGGILSTGDFQRTLVEITTGAKDITPAILRILAAGTLAGVLIKTNSSEKIASYIAEKLGYKNTPLALILATFILTAAGVFIDVAVLTVAPIALAVGGRSNISKTIMLISLVGGGKCGNVISPNPNTIAAAENFGAPLASVMYCNSLAAIAGILITLAIVKFLASRNDCSNCDSKNAKPEPSVILTDAAKEYPNIIAAISGPIAAIALLAARPIFGIAIDPMIALPCGALLCAVSCKKVSHFADDIKYGLAKMTPVAVLLLGTGCLAGIIKASGMKNALLEMMNICGISDIFIAPISGALMSAASASTVGGATIASASFSEAVLASGISAVWGAAMTNAGAIMLDQMPHGSFFHVSGGALGLGFNERLKCVPYESLIGGLIAAVSTLSAYIAMTFGF